VKKITSKSRRTILDSGWSGSNPPPGNIDRKIDELRAFRRRLASGLDGSGRNQFEFCPASRPAKPSRKRPTLSASSEIIGKL